MGPYCKFCDMRCFVPDPWGKAKIHGSPVILATCTEGKTHDRAALGYDIDEARAERDRLNHASLRPATPS